MKRYALLDGQTYYPPPGWTAFRSWHDTLAEASAEGRTYAGEDGSWWQVVDMQTGTLVAGEGKGHSGLFGYVSAGPLPSNKE